MKIIFYVILVGYLIVSDYSIRKGLDIKKWQTWLIGVYAFFSGFVIVSSMSDFINSLLAGLIFALITLHGGIWSLKHQLSSRDND
mgnify:CR=1 FL=1